MTDTNKWQKFVSKLSCWIGLHEWHHEFTAVYHFSKPPETVHVRRCQQCGRIREYIKPESGQRRKVDD